MVSFKNKHLSILRILQNICSKKAKNVYISKNKKHRCPKKSYDYTDINFQFL